MRELRRRDEETQKELRELRRRDEETQKELRRRDEETQKELRELRRGNEERDEETQKLKLEIEGLKTETSFESFFFLSSLLPVFPFLSNNEPFYSHTALFSWLFPMLCFGGSLESSNFGSPQQSNFFLEF